MKQLFKVYVLWLLISIVPVSSTASAEHLRYAVMFNIYAPAVMAEEQKTTETTDANSNYKIFNSAPATAATIEQKIAVEPKPVSANYSDLLFKLLLAETARQRNIPDVALENYLQIATTTKDPKIAQLAVEYAIEIKDFKQARDAAELWSQLDTKNIEPQIIAVTLLIGGDVERAKQYLLTAISINPEQMDLHITALYRKLSPFSQKNMITLLTELSQKNPKDPFVYLYSAQLNAIEGQIAEANNLVDKALSLKPTLTHAIQLKAKLIRHKHNNDTQALQYLAKETEQFPKDNELLIFYSNALLDAHAVDQAIPLLQRLIKNTDNPGQNNPYHNAAKLSLGEAYSLKKQFAKAKAILLEIANTPEHGQVAAYYLGQIAEHQNELAEAVNWYAQVESGEYHIPSVLKAAVILTIEGSPRDALQLIQNASPTTFMEQKRLILTEIDILLEIEEPDQALSLANNALLIIPTDIDFLYARSIIGAMLNRPADIEKDLRTILEIAPDHANALNALGFILANQPERTTEAMQYLKKAMAISPNNPLYMDSMGWLLYQTGHLQEAINWLERAYALGKDSDIAAHLGEVLWANGNKSKAINIWKQALIATPNHSKVLSTIKKLKVEFSAAANANANPNATAR